MSRPTQPEPPPAGKLLRIARNGTGLSIREAARRAKVSESHWRHVEAGYELKGGMQIPVSRPEPSRLARMMFTVGVSPGRLETEGQRPDAAAVLREIQRNESPPVPGPGRTRPPGDLDYLTDEQYWALSDDVKDMARAHVRELRQMADRAIEAQRKGA